MQNLFFASQGIIWFKIIFIEVIAFPIDLPFKSSLLKLSWLSIFSLFRVFLKSLELLSFSLLIKLFIKSFWLIVSVFLLIRFILSILSHLIVKFSYILSFLLIVILSLKSLLLVFRLSKIVIKLLGLSFLESLNQIKWYLQIKIMNYYFLAISNWQLHQNFFSSGPLKIFIFQPHHVWICTDLRFDKTLWEKNYKPFKCTYNN